MHTRARISMEKRKNLHKILINVIIASNLLHHPTEAKLIRNSKNNPDANLAANFKGEMLPDATVEKKSFKPDGGKTYDYTGYDAGSKTDDSTYDMSYTYDDKTYKSEKTYDSGFEDDKLGGYSDVGPMGESTEVVYELENERKPVEPPTAEECEKKKFVRRSDSHCQPTCSDFDLEAGKLRMIPCTKILKWGCGCSDDQKFAMHAGQCVIAAEVCPDYVEKMRIMKNEKEAAIALGKEAKAFDAGEAGLNAEKTVKSDPADTATRTDKTDNGDKSPTTVDDELHREPKKQGKKTAKPTCPNPLTMPHKCANHPNTCDNWISATNKFEKLIVAGFDCQVGCMCKSDYAFVGGKCVKAEEICSGGVKIVFSGLLMGFFVVFMFLE